MPNYLKLLLVLPLALILTACGSPESQRANELKNSLSQGFIAIENNDRELGDISMQNGKVNLDFIFRNTGSESVVLINGESSCMCTSAVIKSKVKNSAGAEEWVISPVIVMPMGGIRETTINQVLDPGEEATLTATFDPNAHGPNAVGPIMREVLIRTNSSQTPELKFSFQGNVIH